MNLQQIRYVRETARRQLNLTQVAAALHTSQPGVSRQLRELEEELGIQIFARAGKRLTHITAPGEVVVALAERIMSDIESLKRVGEEFTANTTGSLTIAATHMQARYILPPLVEAFVRRYPLVKLSIRQGSPRQLAQMVIAGDADLAVATETLDSFEELTTLACYRWRHCVVVPRDHPLSLCDNLTLPQIAQYPIVTYDAAFSGRSALDVTFSSAGIVTHIVLTAIDTDVIKTYVRLGLGIGIIAEVAYDEARDHDLAKLDAAALFPERVAKVAFKKGAYLRGFVREFLAELSADAVDHFAQDKYR
jgi:DNA-binding transcriptional LysR family regulator